MPAADMNSSSGCFTSEILQMQYGFGDSSRPLKETAECVENILHEQLIQILQLLCQNCHQESREIRIEDFLFLLRHSPVKLRKFCQYLQVKDLKKNFIKSGAVDKPSCELNPLTDSGGESKQLAAALIFLNDIDPTGFLASVADPNCDCSLHDEMLQERISRIDRMTISMDIQQYMEYSKARQSSFGRHPVSSKFKDWLLRDSMLPNNILLTPKSWDILSYLAYETVGQLVDLAFIVRRDSTASEVRDTVERNTVPKQLAVNTNLKQVTWTSATKPLLPKEIIEALQRFNTTNLPLSSFSRNVVLPRHRRLLAL